MTQSTPPADAAADAPEITVEVAEAWTARTTYRVRAATAAEARALIAQGQGQVVQRELRERLYCHPDPQG